MGVGLVIGLQGVVNKNGVPLAHVMCMRVFPSFGCYGKQNYLRVFIEHSVMVISWSPKATNRRKLDMQFPAL